jgi:CDP-glucose 4,6-dehydratase
MGGHDPYSSSKGCAELVSSAYRRSFLDSAGISIATARAGNVIGGGDWAIDRLIPDILRNLETGQSVEIRNPGAIRPWQHVLEPISGYLTLAENLYGKDGASFAEAWNFGPQEEDARSVEWIVGQICNQWLGEANWKIQKGQHPHEANFLKLDISKAKQRLNWSPRWNLSTAIASTISWHRAWINGENMHDISLKQIDSYLMSN